MKKYFKAGTIFALFFTLNATAHTETRFETVKKMYDQSSQKAEFSDIEKMQTNGTIDCAIFYQGTNPEFINSSLIYMSRENQEAGPMFPPTIEKKVILLTQYSSPEKLFDVIQISSNDQELVSIVNEASQVGGAPLETRLRKSGVYIVLKNTITWSGKTYIGYGYCWK